jgi:hypothetical protein
MKMNIKNGEIITQLAQAQSEFPVLKQDKAGYNYTYLTLPNILNELRPILGKNGLVLTQSNEVQLQEGMPFVVVSTLVMHKNEYMETTLSYPLGDAPKGMSEIQYLGSIISYLRRYGALSILGIAGAEKEIEDIQTEMIGTTKLNG